MSLSPGTRVGAFEIVEPLGAGGMGEVYRARDSRLGREIALKVLPDAFAEDPERLSRFQREAQLLASLNHPNIAVIYGFEDLGSQRALVLELVEGETLAQRLTRGRPAGDEAVMIARQIADALEAAHERGVIHRDLKPANVKITPEGKVKVLDFGLAKAMETAPAASQLTHSPTLSLAGTFAGVILGTAAYMSPEQAKGLPADQRSDVFSFGCVLYELLTGRQAFEADTATEILAAVLMREPDLAALPANLNPRLVALVRRCLDKQPKRRWQAMGDVRYELDAIAADPAGAAARSGAPAPPSPPRARWRIVLPIAATAILVGASMSAMWMLRSRAVAPVVRFPILLPEDQSFPRSAVSQVVAMSPDGTQLVYAANRQLYLRSLAEMDARPIPGTNVDPVEPVFSPDGQWIAFWSIVDSSIRKIAVSGGAPLTLCKTDPIGGLSWDGDSLLFAQSGGAVQGVMRVSANGGSPELLVPVAPPSAAFGPQLLDRDHVLFSLASEASIERWDRAAIVVQSLATKERQTVLQGGSAARYLPSGHLVYALAGTLLAVAFDAKSLTVRGGPVPVVDGVRRAPSPALQPGGAQFAVSSSGALAFVPGSVSPSVGPRAIGFATRDGRMQQLELPLQPYIYPRISPDGRQLAIQTDDDREANLFVYDLQARGSLRRLTFGGHNRFPVWSPDGRYLAFQSDREGDRAIFRQLADGSGPAERLTKPEAGSAHEPESWSPDGKTMTLNMTSRNNQGVWTIRLDGADRTPAVFVDAPVIVEKHSVFSPDGRWLAYMSNTRAGNTNPEVFVQPFPATGAKYQISTDGGRTPQWSRDGKQLFFHQDSSNKMYVVDVRTQPTFTFSKPIAMPIDRTVHPIAQRNFDVGPDGRLVFVLPPTGPESSGRPVQQINVVLNWFEELKTRVPLK